MPECRRRVLQAVEVLTTSPLIGRPVEGGKQEIVIGRGCATGFDSEAECLAAARERRHTEVPAGPKAKQG